MEYEIVNIVATASTGISIDPVVSAEVLKTLGKVKYEPKRFPGLILKMKNGMSVLIFRSGKMVVAGGKTTADIKKVVKEVLSALWPVVQQLPKKIDVHIQNIVATAHAGTRLDLEHLSKTLPNNLYVPEIFPGLIHKPDLGMPAILMFSTGNMVIVGSRSEEDVRRACEYIRSVILKQE